MKIHNFGAYLRISIEDGIDSESSSIVNQRNIINDYCMQNNINIVKFYCDDGYSGSNYNRPGFIEMIDDLKTGIINSVIVKDISRLGREFLETGNYLFKYFPENNIRFISISDNYDSFLYKDNVDFLPFRTVINDLYLRDVSNKIKAVRHNKMNQGLYMGSTVPYGYKRGNIKGVFIIDDYSSMIVRMMFYLRFFNFSYGTIAKFLTNNYVLPPNIYSNKKSNPLTMMSFLWKESTVKNILSNKIYIGYLIQGRYDRVNLRLSKRILLPENKWYMVFNPNYILVDKNIFDCVQKINLMKIRRSKNTYLLKGLVYCSCGNLFFVKKINNKFYYVCSNKSKCNIRKSYNEFKINSIVNNNLKKSLIKKIDSNYCDYIFPIILSDNKFLNFKNKLYNDVSDFRDSLKININFIEDLDSKNIYIKQIEKYNDFLDKYNYNFNFLLGSNNGLKCKIIKKFIKTIINNNFYLRFFIERIIIDNKINIYYRFNNE